MDVFDMLGAAICATAILLITAGYAARETDPARTMRDRGIDMLLLFTNILALLYWTSELWSQG